MHTLLEVHLFDFSADLYGREIEVEFVAKLRDEEHFPTLEALVFQSRLLGILYLGLAAASYVMLRRA